MNGTEKETPICVNKCYIIVIQRNLKFNWEEIKLVNNSGERVKYWGENTSLKTLMPSIYLSI